MEPLKRQTLRLVENLTLPTVQVVVIRANMSCSHCQQRVSNIISKMNGLTDCVVDVGKKEVIVRSIEDTKGRKKKKKKSGKTLTSLFALLRPVCCNPATVVAGTKF